jgi:hypothetical protein
MHLVYSASAAAVDRLKEYIGGMGQYFYPPFD